MRYDVYKAGEVLTMKRYMQVLSVGAVMVSFAVCCAADAPAAGMNPPPSPQGGGMRRGEFPGRSGMRERFENFSRQLKEKFPAEYAEIEKLRGSDRMAAMRKTMELANKAGIEMPWGRRGMMGPRGGGGSALAEWPKFFAELKEKAPTEFTAIEQKIVSRPQEALKELKALAEKHGLKMPEGPLPGTGAGQPALNRNRNRFMVERANRILERSRPEEYARLQSLRETDENAAREYFRKLAKEEGLTPHRLLAEPIRPVQSVSFSDKDLEELYPAPVNQRPGWGGWGGRGPWGGGFRR